MTGHTATERLLRRERLLVIAGLLGVCLLSWVYLLGGAGTGMSTVAMTTWQFPPPRYGGTVAAWPAVYWLIMVGMWWVMMIAMMLPSAAPMILLYARVVRHNRKPAAGAGVVVPTAAFLLGYLLAWLLFSLAATLLQWLLEQAGLVHGMMMWSNSHTLTAILLLGAGFYQLSPLKNTCLAHCRSPAAFLSRHWHNGRIGALRMGLVHGLYCIGCCWTLMLLLFAGGVMNLVWIAGLALLVLLEKVVPQPALVVRSTGVMLVAAGAAMLLHAAMYGSG